MNQRKNKNYHLNMRNYNHSLNISTYRCGQILEGRLPNYWEWECTKKGENLPGFLGSTAFKTLSHNHKIINTLQKATCIGYIVESTKIYSRSGNQLSASCYKKQLSAAALFTGESS